MVVSLWQILAGADDGAWKGHLMFLTGSGCWAVYSVIFRQSGLSPLHGLVIGLFWGTLLITPLLLATGNVSFATASPGDIAVMIVLQSFVIGILAMFLFGYAVQILGAAETAAFGALTPILALLGGVAFLGRNRDAAQGRWRHPGGGRRLSCLGRSQQGPVGARDLTSAQRSCANGACLQAIPRKPRHNIAGVRTRRMTDNHSDRYAFLGNAAQLGP